MNGALDGLGDALAEEIRLERELAAAAGRRREALVSLDAAAVERASSREAELLAALAGAADRRRRWTSDLARSLVLPAAESSLTRVAAAVGEPARTRLEALAAELREALRELARVNDATRALTGRTLDHVKRAFGLLGGAREPGLYSRRGLQPRAMGDAIV